MTGSGWLFRFLDADQTTVRRYYVWIEDADVAEAYLRENLQLGFEVLVDSVRVPEAVLRRLEEKGKITPGSLRSFEDAQSA